MSALLLSVNNVRVTFDALTALDDVSIDVGQHEIVSLIGPNGAGKTTLFNVICGFIRPTDGSVEFGGKRRRHHRPTDLPSMGVARTLQGVNLWKGLTVVENVMAGGQASCRAGLLASVLGLPRSSREESSLRRRALETLDRLGIAHASPALPESLPYGVQKRVAIARALMAEPTLLLLDEPASGLSASEMEEMAVLLRQCRSEMSVLVVEHHMDFVMSISDRIVVLNFGRVIAVGTPDEVRSDPEVTTAYLGEQVDVDHDPVAATSVPPSGEAPT